MIKVVTSIISKYRQLAKRTSAEESTFSKNLRRKVVGRFSSTLESSAVESSAVEFFAVGSGTRES